MNERLCVWVSKFALSTSADWEKNYIFLFNLSQDSLLFHRIIYKSSKLLQLYKNSKYNLLPIALDSKRG